MINAKNFGLAGGILWGGIMFLFTLFSSLTGYGFNWLNIWLEVHPFYAVTLFGSLLGLFWGFIDGFMFFFLLGWIYNKLS